MNIQQLAQDFNQREGRAMTFGDSVEIASKSKGFKDWDYVPGLDEVEVLELAAELYAESVRLFEREKVIGEYKNYVTSEYCESCNEREDKLNKEIVELKDKINSMDRALGLF